MAIANSDPEIDIVLKCLPGGFPRSIMSRAPFHIVQSASVIIVIGGRGGRPQTIYMDEEHQDLWPLYMGDSIGRWEDDTLVVDVVNVNTKTFMHDDGMPHSEELHVVERLRLLDEDTLENVITMEDPKILTRPWVITMVYDRRDDLKPVENVCENLRLLP